MRRIRRTGSGFAVLSTLVVMAIVGGVLGGCATPSSGDAAALPVSGAAGATAVPTTFPGRGSPGCRSGGAAAPGPSGTTATTSASGSSTYDAGGTTRTYQLAVPSGHPPDEPLPLLVELHGFDGSGAELAARTGLADKGTAAGMLVASPDGTDRTWQLNPHGADAAAMDALLDHLAATRCIDLDRVHLTGFSAGAAFTIAYACTRPDRVASIATVAVDFQLGCKRPMPYLAFHGTKDPLVPYDDGAVGLSLKGVAVRGSENNLRDWASLDGCAPEPTTDVLGTEVTRESWSGCADGTEVVFYRVEGGGHTWPGSDPATAVGLTTQQLNASDEILRFFARHPARPA